MIYLQQLSDNEPLNEDVRCLAEYLDSENLMYQFIKFETIKELNHSKKRLFVGSIEFMQEAFFYQCGSLVYPTLIDNPFREGEVMLVKDFIKDIKKGEKWFVKPYGGANMKKFSGFVCCNLTITFLGYYNGLVIRYKPLEKKIVSEWRAFIDGDKMLDIRNYSGDPCVFPSTEFVNKAIARMNEEPNPPKAFCVDVGVLEDGENILIEYTDMWSVGAYGCDIQYYFKLLKKRYFNILEQQCQI